MPVLALPMSAVEPWCQLSAAEEDAESSSGVLMAEEQLLSPGDSSEAPETVQEVHRRPKLVFVDYGGTVCRLTMPSEREHGGPCSCSARVLLARPPKHQLPSTS